MVILFEELMKLQITGPGDTALMQEKKKKNILSQLSSLQKWIYKSSPSELPALNELLETSWISKPASKVTKNAHIAQFFEQRRGKSQLATTQPNSPRKVSIDLHIADISA